MNPLAKLNKSLREVEVAYGQCKTDETRRKAVEAIRGVLGRVEPIVATSVSVGGVEPEVDSVTVGAVGARVDGESDCGAAETASVGVVDDKLPEKEIVVSQDIGGWPAVGMVTIIGLAANRRTLRGRLEDGRGVCLERHFRAWKVEDKVKARLIRAGAAPLYRIV